mmetsp:Transcript_51406/g.111518  ORF Transcript_51406/g.111518 Transcript_51406/m.111518 type:complete len:210 (+) Transcript_51406:102-731(+)
MQDQTQGRARVEAMRIHVSTETCPKRQSQQAAVAEPNPSCWARGAALAVGRRRLLKRARAHGREAPHVLAKGAGGASGGTGSALDLCLQLDVGVHAVRAAMPLYSLCPEASWAVQGRGALDVGAWVHNAIALLHAGLIRQLQGKEVLVGLDGLLRLNVLLLLALETVMDLYVLLGLPCHLGGHIRSCPQRNGADQKRAKEEAEGGLHCG